MCQERCPPHAHASALSPTPQPLPEMSLCGAMVMAGVSAEADVIAGSALKRETSVRKRDLLSTHAGSVAFVHTHMHTHT